MRTDEKPRVVNVIPWDGYDLKIIIEPIDDRFKMPEYSDPEDAGLDVFACLFDANGNPIDEIKVYPGKTVLISTGFKVGLPRGWYLAVVPRSGISLHTPLKVKNSPGTIDTGYKGTVGVLVENTSMPEHHVVYKEVLVPEHGYFKRVPKIDLSYVNYPTYHCSEKGQKHGIYTIRTGDKIAQLIPARRYKAKLELGKVDDIGSNRGGGWGHSGV